MRKTSEKQMQWVKEYQKTKCDQITIRPVIGTKERWKEAAEREGKSLQRFIIDAVENHIAKDGE